jgi:hypothetical protein
MKKPSFNAGTLVRIKDFQFEDGSIRDKYLIVLFRNDEATFIIHTLTTSKNNLNLLSKQHGCNVQTHNNHAIPYFFFPENHVLDAVSGFYFDVDTYIFFLNNITKVPIEAFKRYDSDVFSLIELAQLNTFELKRLLKCILKSSFVPNDIKTILTDFKESL